MPGLFGRAQGQRLIANGSVSAANFRLDVTTANAFAWLNGVDLSSYQDGRHIIALYDTSNRAAVAYISASAPGGLTLVEAFANVDMELNSTWVGFISTPETCERSNEQAHGGTYSWKQVQSSGSYWGIGQDVTLTQGGLYYADAWFYKTSDTTPNFQMALDSGRTDVVNFGNPTKDTWTNKTGYVNKTISGASAAGYYDGNGSNTTVYTDDFSLGRVTVPPATGALLLSTKGGSRGWISKDASFNPAVGGTYKIYYTGA